MAIDTISDMLTRIRNANLAKHTIVRVPSTKITRNVADLLLNEGFIKSFEELKNGPKSFLFLLLKYTGTKRDPVITKIKRISKPGRRVYNSHSSLTKIPRRILSSFGIAIISTSEGLMTNKRAKEKGIGGELLFFIW
jgi:small subunit ribosomal protein S8